MSTPTTSQGSSISHSLRATKKLLHGVSFDARTAATLDEGELDVLEQDAFDILRLVRSWKNRIAPINRIPPEILALVPDFWQNRDKDVIALTHVCQAWREVFVSRPSLWNNIDCVNMDLDKTRVYFKRSKTSPINLILDCRYINPSDPLFDFLPSVGGRLKSLDIRADPEGLQAVSPYLSLPTPLLEVLSIRGKGNPVLQSALFDGDLSSLRELQLEDVHTKLPWRSVVNLTSFTLDSDPFPVSVNQLLDFLEGAPHLRKVKIHSTTPITPGVPNGRLVSLAHLQWMDTTHFPHSPLFDHLLIPVGVRMTMTMDLPTPPVEDHPLRFIDNLKNLSNFTTIKLDHGPGVMKFSGPNGEVEMAHRVNDTSSVFEFLARIDTSKTESLEISWGGCPSRDLFYRALLPMKDLRTIKLYQRGDPHHLAHALHPGMSSSGVVICPQLEKLVIQLKRPFHVKDLAGAAAARASGGAKFKHVRITTWDKTEFPPADLLELEKHVLRVTYGH